MIDWIDLVCRILASGLCGALIGFERQWRGRMAGIRTNALVSLGSALFVVLGAYSFSDGKSDPTRVAAQIVSGIGFLGAGVIMKQGSSVSGINTAATLWAAAAVGALAGSGMVIVSLLGTCAVLVVNAALRPVGRVLDRRLGINGDAGWDDVDYTFDISCPREHEAEVRVLAVRVLHRPDVTVTSVSSAPTDDGRAVVTIGMTAQAYDERRVELVVADLLGTAEVLGVQWRRRDPVPVRGGAARNAPVPRRGGRHRTAPTPVREEDRTWPRSPAPAGGAQGDTPRDGEAAAAEGLPARPRAAAAARRAARVRARAELSPVVPEPCPERAERSVRGAEG